MINTKNNTVSARTLYEFLEVRKDFSNWMKYQIKNYGFENNIDYSVAKIGEGNAHNKIDYILTLDCAKQLSMVQRNVKGRMARKYFIECERIAKGKQTLQVDILQKKLSVYERMEQINQIRKTLAREMKTLVQNMIEVKAKEKILFENEQYLLF